MGVPTGGGQQLGQATGSITISTAQLAQAQAAVKAFATGVNTTLTGINVGTAQAQRGISGFAGAFNQLGGAVGVSLSVAGAMRAIGAAVEQANLATTFDRQHFSAVRLAGSQAQLNKLLEAYREAMGGTVNEAQALADVISLQAQGFAKNAAQLKTLLEGVRGASLATGKPQEFIVSRLQLELLNQTGLRLNELGLSMAEVRQRAEELSNANAGLSKEAAYQQAVIEKLSEKFGSLSKSNEGQKSGLERLADSWGNLGLAIGQLIQGPLGAFAGAVSKSVDLSTERFKNLLIVINQVGDKLRQLGILGADLSGPISSRTGIGANIRQAPTAAPRFSGDQLAAITEWSRGVQEIERNANRARLDATRQYEEQRTNTIRQYEQTIAREAQDFAIGRARAEEDYALGLQRLRRDIAQREAGQLRDLERTIADARSDAIERGAERQAALEERIAETREQTNERISEMERDFNRQRERTQADFRDKQLSAAGRLDAIALLELRKDRTRQLRDNQESFNERLAKERKNEEKRIAELNKAHEKQAADEARALQKRIDEANRAYQRQLEDARAADEQRLSDMSADFALRKEREDEDRKRRLERLAEDHQAQLDEMARQHALEMVQINADAAEELAAHNEAFDDQMALLGVYHADVLKRQEEFQTNALALYEQYLASQEAALARRILAESGGPSDSLNPSQFVNPLITPANYSVGGRERSRNITANITIYGDGLNEQQVAEKVIDMIEQLGDR